MSSLRGLVLPLYLPTLLLAAGQGMLVPVIPLYASTFGVSIGLISLAVASLGLGTLMADMPIGMLLERFGRRRMMLMGSFGYAAGTFGLGMAQSFHHLIIFQLIAGASVAMWGISRVAFVTDSVPIHDRGRALATLGGIMRIGTFLGPALGGLIGGLLGFQAACFATAGVATMALMLAILYAPDSGGSAPKQATLRWQVLAEVFQTRRKALAAAGTAQIAVQMIRAGRQLIVPLYAGTILGMDVAAVGMLVSASWAVEVALFFPAGVIMDRYGRKYASVPCFTILAIGMAIIPLTQSIPGLIAAVLVMGVGNGLGAGSMMTLGADLAPRHATGEFLGIWRVVGDTGQSGGPLLVGAVSSFVGINLAAFAISGVGIFAALMLALFVEETRKPVPVRSRTTAAAGPK